MSGLTFRARLLVLAALATLPACMDDTPAIESAPAPASAPGAASSAGTSVLPPVLTASQQLAMDLLQSSFAAADLPPGASASSGQRSAPSPRARELNAEAKVTFDIKGANVSDKVSYTVYPRAEDAAAALAAIGEPVPGRTIKSAEKVAVEGFTGPTWGESTLEEYPGQTILRTSLATVSGTAVVLSQSIVEVGAGAAPAAPVAYATALLGGAVRHIEKLAGARSAALSPSDAPAPR